MKFQIKLSIPEELADLSEKEIQLAHERAETQKNKVDLFKTGTLLAILTPIFLITTFRKTMTSTVYISLILLVLVVMSSLGGAALKYFWFKLIIKEMRKIKFEQMSAHYSKPRSRLGKCDSNVRREK